MYSYTINDLSDSERLCCTSEIFKSPSAMRNLMKRNGMWKHGHDFIISIIDHIDKRKMTFSYNASDKAWTAKEPITPLDNKEVCFLID